MATVESIQNRATSTQLDIHSRNLPSYNVNVKRACRFDDFLLALPSRSRLQSECH